MLNHEMPVRPENTDDDKPTRAARRQRARSGRRDDGNVAGVSSDAELASAVLARRVRELRVAAHLSVTELARRANISAGMVSQIENAKATPSIATLVGIAGALDARIADFFEDRVEPGRVVRRGERRVIEYPAIGVRDEMVSADPTGRLQVLIAHIDAGRNSGREGFVHGSEAECVLVLEGQITIVLADQEVDLEEGDCLTFSGDVPHGFSNKGTCPARLVWIITPVSY